MRKLQADEQKGNKPTSDPFIELLCSYGETNVDEKSEQVRARDVNMDQ